MVDEKKSTTYNQRLFSGGIRKRIHLARFFWLTKKVKALANPPKRVFELGCYDGKAINFLPTPPEVYHGYDANWENGLGLAREMWKDHPEFKFFECQKPEDIQEAANSFDISMSMETVEHVPVRFVEGFVAKMAEVTTDTCYITVPNEKGILFFFKYIFKRLTGKQMAEYSFSEVIHASLGNMNKVKRKEGGHKGFDYETVAAFARKYFREVRLEGIQVSWLPASLNVSVAIVCKK